MSRRAARRLAWSAASVSITLVTIGLVLSLVALIASDGELGPAPHQFFNPVTTVAFSVVGALVASRHPRNPIGWLCSGIGFLTGLTLLSLGYSFYNRSVVSGSLPGTEFARWLDIWIWIPPTTVPMTFLLLFFPDGRLPSRRWWPIGWSAGLGLAGVVLGAALHWWAYSAVSGSWGRGFSRATRPARGTRRLASCISSSRLSHSPACWWRFLSCRAG